MSETVREAIANELEIDPSELTSDKLLDEIEAWDSVIALTLTVILSDELGMPVTSAEIKDLKTYGDIEKLLEVKKKQRYNL